VFTAAAAVLVLEILAGRLLAPYVGVTLETFTGIIGTILAGISLGSWVGGRLADRHDPRMLLGIEFMLGGALALLAPPIVDTLGEGVRGADPTTIVVLAATSFFAPAAVLSAVTPTVVKLQLASLDQTGQIVGRLSAIGTAGAIIGTFVTGFLLIAAAPTRPVVFGLGVFLVVVGVALWWGLRRSAGPAPVSLLVLAGIGAVVSLAVTGPCEHESAYFCARVEVDPQRPSGRVLWLDTLRHSYVDLDDPTYLEFTYAQTLSDVTAAIAPPGRRLEVLHIGGGGFSMPRYLAATRPGTSSLVLELDPELVELAREELGLQTGPDLQVVTGDARLTIQDTPEAAYDLVIGDAFGGVAVPWHLTTREFLELIDARLRPGGVYAMNAIDFPPLGFVAAEVHTFRQVWDHVAVIAPVNRLSGERGGNFILLGSHEPLPIDAILRRNRDRGDDEAALVNDEVVGFVGGAQVLTDDHAPVDQLITPLPPATPTVRG
jgi:spermidine synthase